MLWHAASSTPPTILRARGIFNVDLYYMAKLKQPKEEQPLSHQSRTTVLEDRDMALVSQAAQHQKMD